jgi:hypothetical protein
MPLPMRYRIFLVHFLKTYGARCFPGNAGLQPGPAATLERGAPREMHQNPGGEALGLANF